MNIEPKNKDKDMEKSVSVKTLLAFVAAIGIPVLIFLWTLNLRTETNEIRSFENQRKINEIMQTQKQAIHDNDENFDKVLEKLHDIDLKLKDKADRR